MLIVFTTSVLKYLSADGWLNLNVHKVTLKC